MKKSWMPIKDKICNCLLNFIIKINRILLLQLLKKVHKQIIFQVNLNKFFQNKLFK